MPPTDVEIARHFRRYSRGRRTAADDWYGGAGTFRKTVIRAITSEDEEGLLNSHQWRNGRAALQVAKEALLQSLSALQRCSVFEELHDEVLRIIGPLDRIGALAVYDCAQRIAVAQDIDAPAVVYLHAGTAKGAKARGIRGKVAAKSRFPAVYRRFSTFELEDLLCNYAPYLNGKELPDGPLPKFARAGRRGC